MKITLILFCLLSLSLLVFVQGRGGKHRKASKKGNRMVKNRNKIAPPSQPAQPMMQAQPPNSMMQAQQQNSMMQALTQGSMMQNTMMRLRNEMMQAQTMANSQNAVPIGSTVPVDGTTNIWQPIMQDMMSDMERIKDSYDDPDIDFCAEMIPHHWAAIFMCEEEFKMGQSQILKDMCVHIQWSQLTDISTMDAFLKSKGVDYVDPSLVPSVDYTIQWDGEAYNPQEYMANGVVPNWKKMGAAISEGMSLQQFLAQNNSS